MSVRRVAITTYRVLPGAEARFDTLLAAHWPTLRDKGLVSDEPAYQHRHTSPGGGPLVVEVFTWRDAEAEERARVDVDLQAWHAELAEVLACP